MIEEESPSEPEEQWAYVLTVDYVIGDDTGEVKILGVSTDLQARESSLSQGV